MPGCLEPGYPEAGIINKGGTSAGLTLILVNSYLMGSGSAPIQLTDGK